MTLLEIISNPSNYVPCTKKNYTVHICKPVLGTMIINKIEQPKLVAQLGSAYLPASTVLRLQSTGNPLYKTVVGLCSTGRARLTTERTPIVLAGTRGELSVVSVEYIRRMFNWNANLAALNTWHRVEYTLNESFAACFVPVGIAGQVATSYGVTLDINIPGVSHGCGDFVVCSVNRAGQRNLNDRRVINGVIFGDTFNNTGFTANLCDVDTKMMPKNVTIDMLPDLSGRKTARVGA